jgi:hypothetical protein
VSTACAPRRFAIHEAAHATIARVLGVHVTHCDLHAAHTLHRRGDPDASRREAEKLVRRNWPAILRVALEGAFLLQCQRGIAGYIGGKNGRYLPKSNVRLWQILLQKSALIFALALMCSVESRPGGRVVDLVALCLR